MKISCGLFTLKIESWSSRNKNVLLRKGAIITWSSVPLEQMVQGLILDSAKSMDMRLLLGSLCEAVLIEARGAGLGNQDMAALIRPLERLMGIEVKG